MKNFPEYTNSQMAALIDEYIHSRRDRDILKEQLERAMSEAPTERSREAIRMAMEQLEAE